MHEHIFVRSTDVSLNYADNWGTDAVRIDDAERKLRAAVDAGVRTIVDMTVVGLGRDIGLMRRVAERVPELNIVAATGLYIYRDLPLQFGQRGPGRLFDCEEYLDKLFIRDIREGIAGTEITAGVLKCTTDAPGVTPDVARVLRAVAHAHLATGVPISTHTDAGTRRGLEQQAVFAEEGVDLGSVVIGHSGDTTDLDYLLRLIDNGSYIGLDRFGFDPALSANARVDTLVALCERGLAERIVLSHDCSCHNEWLDYDLLPQIAPDWAFTLIPDVVVPDLRRRGVSVQDIDAMLVANPAKILGSQGSTKNVQTPREAATRNG